LNVNRCYEKHMFVHVILILSLCLVQLKSIFYTKETSATKLSSLKKNIRLNSEWISRYCTKQSYWVHLSTVQKRSIERSANDSCWRPLPLPNPKPPEPSRGRPLLSLPVAGVGRGGSQFFSRFSKSVACWPLKTDLAQSHLALLTFKRTVWHWALSLKQWLDFNFFYYSKSSYWAWARNKSMRMKGLLVILVRHLGK